MLRTVAVMALAMGLLGATLCRTQMPRAILPRPYPPGAERQAVHSGADSGGTLTIGRVDSPAVHRTGGYAPIRDYAAIGDGRTVALVARDGAIDWLPLPDVDGPAVFAAMLDAEAGGSFVLAPDGPFDVSRRYVPGTNVLETTFTTAGGAVRVTDALTLPGRGLTPLRELVRRVEGLSGSVPMRWSVGPRFGFGRGRIRLGWRRTVPVAVRGRQAVALRCWDAGEPEVRSDSVRGTFQAHAGRSSLLTLGAAHQEPLVLPSRAEVEARLAHTVDSWRTWTGERRYDGPWREEVLRSALALKLLVYAPSGAVAAAPTTSLPEEIGGERNWDYRFSWLRDSVFTMRAFLSLGCHHEADAFFWWLMHASQITRPRLRVLYRLNGGTDADERTLPLDGYRSSRPVRTGNEAAAQEQLDIYGYLIQTASLFAQSGRDLQRDLAARLAGAADVVCDIWARPDSGIWEVRSPPQHFTQSKMLCWAALHEAVRMVERGLIRRADVARWRRTAERIHGFVENRCWSERKGSYVRAAGSAELDASLLLGAMVEWPNPERVRSTVDAVRRELGRGPYVYRYSGEDGLPGSEGAFVACSFWLVEALARSGRGDEAAELMERMLAVANDVGLYAEEVDPASGDFLGNMPQALSHLALINAATALGEEGRP